MTGFCTLAWQDDIEAAKTLTTQLRASGQLPSPNLGVVMGRDFAQLSANVGRNLVEGRLGILTAAFEAASKKTRIHMENRSDDRRNCSRWYCLAPSRLAQPALDRPGHG
jgi:sarcosine/dimethylglycine N-methyltransferase